MHHIFNIYSNTLSPYVHGAAGVQYMDLDAVVMKMYTEIEFLTDIDQNPSASIVHPKEKCHSKLLNTHQHSPKYTH